MMTAESAGEAIVFDPSGEHRSTVIWLHGLGADGYDFASLPEALRLPPGQGIRFIFPHAPVRQVSINNNMRMRAWFDIASGDLTADVSQQHIQEITLLLDALISNQGGCPVVLAGFSQGGATALATGLLRNPPVSGILSVSGWLPPLAWQPADISSARVPMLLLHGAEDDVIPVNLARQSYSYLLQAEQPAAMKIFHNVGHTLAAEAIPDIRDWLLSVLDVAA